MGGQRTSFPETPWTKLLCSAPEKVVEQGLAVWYWKPIYCYLRRRGFANEDAKNITQEFFMNIIVGRKLYARVDASQRGFRWLLLTALRNYTVSWLRREKPRKDRPSESSDKLTGALPDEGRLDPEGCFEYALASRLLDVVLSELEEQCREDGFDLHWTVFYEKLVQPIIEATKAPSYAELCQCHRIESEKHAANMIETVKRRSIRLFERYIKELDGPGVDVGEEIDRLKAVLSGRLP
jgi:RNA polymerase sigma-70 factor (ECF subfamily)